MIGFFEFSAEEFEYYFGLFNRYFPPLTNRISPFTDPSKKFRDGKSDLTKMLVLCDIKRLIPSVV